MRPKRLWNSGGDDSDFGKDEDVKLSTRKPESRRVQIERSLSPEYAALRPRVKKEDKPAQEHIKESPDEIFGDESLGFRQAKLENMKSSRQASSEEESSEREFQPRPRAGSSRTAAAPTKLTDIKAQPKKRISDKGLELREGQPRPSCTSPSA